MRKKFKCTKLKMLKPNKVTADLNVLNSNLLVETKVYENHK